MENNIMKKFKMELKKVGGTAAPMVVVAVVQYLLQVVSVIMVGQIDAMSLAAVAIATSFTNVTGFSFLVGMAGGLETLCGQAYGAKQYKKLGIYTYSTLFSLLLICVPISVLWIYIDKILILLGQNSSISILARNYAVWLIPNLFSYAVLQALIRYFQTQNLVLPILFSALLSLCIHIPLCWALVFRLKLEMVGAALSIGLSYWLEVIALGLYAKYSPSCEKTRAAFSMDAFRCIREFLQFGFPSAVMVCLEWWVYELLVLLAGILPDSKVETSVLAICITITSLHYFVPYGLGAALSTRISNELGAGNPQAAKLALWTLISIAFVESVIISAALFSSRHILGYAFSNDVTIVRYIANMVPLLCLTLISDSLQVVLSGFIRGCGWQHMGAYVNLGAYYLVGTPLAITLTFLFKLRGKGLWIGLTAGSAVQATMLAIVAIFTNWEKQAKLARERMFNKEQSDDTFREVEME
ncbi:unnamed protein product [Rhodiola kirilowii]